ncbi:MAG TPA: hypothetical protein VGG49_08240 [Steroidobacteraceae bacterium]
MLKSENAGSAPQAAARHSDADSLQAAAYSRSGAAPGAAADAAD